MGKGRTIQEVIDSGDMITAHCHSSRCHHKQALDFLKLRDKLGPDHGAMHDDLVPMLRCSKCGGKEVGIIVHAKAAIAKSEGPIYAPNAYQKWKDGR